MADIEVVIKIPEDEYNIAKYGQYGNINVDIVRKALANGVPLPKGHGRLIDADALEKKMCDREEELGDDEALWESSAVSVALDMFAPTIIDKEGERK